MTSKMTVMQPQKKSLEYPIAMRLKYNVKNDPTDPIKNGHQEVVVLFTDVNRGILLHQKDGKLPFQNLDPLETWIEATNDCWEPFVGKIELTFP